MPVKLPRSVVEQNEKADKLKAEILARQAPILGPVAQDDLTPAEVTPVPDVVPPVVTPALLQAPVDQIGASPAGETPPVDMEQQLRVESGRVRILSDQNQTQGEDLRAYAAREADMKTQIEAQAQELKQLSAAGQKSNLDLMLSEMEEDPERADEAAMFRHLHETVQEQGQLLSTLQGAQKTQALSAHDKFWEGLRNGVPNRSTIDADPAFKTWVNKPDEHVSLMTGSTQTRQDLLEGHMRAVGPDNVDKCVASVVAIYKQWLQASTTAPVPSVAPERSAGGEPLEGAKGIQWTADIVKQFYIDARRKRYTPEQYESLEADLQRAPAEGRYKKT